MKPSTATFGVLVASALWASSGLAEWITQGTVAPIALADTRLCLGGLALTALVGLRRTAQAWRRLNRRAIACAVLGMALFQWCFFASVAGLGVGLAALLPALVAPTAADAIETRRGPRSGGAALVSAITLVGGVALLCRRFDAVAVTAALAAGVSYAFYAAATASAQRSHDGHADGLAITALALLGAGLALLPLAAPSLHSMTNPSGLLAAVYLAVPATALGYAIFAAGLRHMAASRALLLVLIPPALAFGFEALHRGSALAPAAVWGVLLLAGPQAARHVAPLVSGSSRPA